MPSVTKVPKNWPDNLVYLTAPVYARSVQLAHLRAADTTNPALPVIKAPESSSDVHIKPISDSLHPAHGQSGLFASKNLTPDTFICSYMGFVHGPAETDSASNYDLSLDRELQIGVDATDMGNEARFINDYRGIRPDGPNAEFRDCLVDIGGLLERRIGVFVLGPGKKGGRRARGISKGDEIVVSYGKGFWSHRTQEGEAE